jgi:hypothetical protein
VSNDAPILCTTCGDRIGIYEPVWLEEPNGALTRTGLLKIKQAYSEPHRLRLHHLNCRSPLRLVPEAGT